MFMMSEAKRKKMLEELDAEARNEGEVEAVREIAAEG